MCELFLTLTCTDADLGGCISSCRWRCRAEKVHLSLPGLGVGVVAALCHRCGVVGHFLLVLVCSPRICH